MVEKNGELPICITGMAWTTSLGSDLDSVWEKLLDGHTGVSCIPSAYPLRNNLAAAVSNISLEYKENERQHILAVKTLVSALNHAHLGFNDKNIQIILGTSFGSHLDDPSFNSLHEWAVNISNEVEAYNPPISLTTACSSGSDSILVGAELIRNKKKDICVCGGVDILTNSKRLAHSALGTMSPNFLYAFDERHDGMLLGEGAGFLVLESYESAIRRSATIHGYLKGTGASNDASGMTSPDMTGDSIILSVQRALKDADLNVEDINIVNAHGSGTPVNDMVEKTSLHRLFGDGNKKPVVFATKGAFGHSLGATGILEAISVILALKDAKTPPIYGLQKPMEEFSLPLSIQQPHSFEGKIGASLTLGFGGFNTCLIFEGID
ncbi:beta-ketoacyl synthase [Bacillus cereus]|uniref:Beta-ketoacyl synthase n=1 Tax=Bacillus cereus TaxID=1396 RepID=A0A9X6Z7V8_BACCE|nr:beta-ketoacyl-[acyl-carrier-protein] synthase family protein [Bacillus cereus]HDR6315060.1 beta-ketoacyl-[acyl-carrier-protein] synthase family protein [Bacillus thuringiensis]PFB30162.1 beta-ketoacyl synthase [Bacillus cereus]PFC08095.1 beta-ketoacyl synthase [Bacillus cereus]PFD19386.1 beta-ketoacyl synthase [Bacillus cereus]PFL58318.1 beta-ketoacyl synthase [Bacillus cereus]